MQEAASNQLVGIWFSHLSGHLPGFTDGCVYRVEPISQEIGDVITASRDNFADDKIRMVAESSIRRRKAIVQRVSADSSRVESLATADGSTVSDISQNHFLVTYPVILERKLIAVFSARICTPRSDHNIDPLAEAEKAVDWLISLASTGLISIAGMSESATTGQARLAVELCATLVSHDDAMSAATAVASRLESEMKCERISIGFTKDESAHVYAISNNASYESRQNLVRRIEAAMQESTDQKSTLVYPVRDGKLQSVNAHKELSSHHDHNSICTVPVVHADNIIGAFCFERRQAVDAFSSEDERLCELMTSLLGPLLHYRRNDELSLGQKIMLAADQGYQDLMSRNKLSRHALIAAAALTLGTLSLMDWPYRVTSEASLEGTIERVITAPEDGYISLAAARPGDIVSKGDELATLDDKDLQLEKLKWSGKSQQVSREFREALAGNDRSRIGILRAQRDQADAQLSILEKKLQRTHITAPIDGVIVSGDLTQSLGSPVEKGQILYQVSPLDDYRVILRVDEADVTDIRRGMPGQLTLNAAAEESIGFRIEKITPVSHAENGSNTYQVEASLIDTPPYLRPGMQGIGKIEAGERSLIWIWTHDMVDWMRLKLWTWM